MQRFSARIMIAAVAAAAIATLPGLSHAKSGASPSNSHGPIQWMTSLSRAEDRAAREHKLIFADFYADWCGPCQVMLHTTYQDKRIVNLSKKFIPVLINVDEQPALAQKYGVQSIPTVSFLDSRGKLLKGSVGYTGADDFLQTANGVLAKYGHSSLASRSRQRS